MPRIYSFVVILAIVVTLTDAQALFGRRRLRRTGNRGNAIQDQLQALPTFIDPLPIENGQFQLVKCKEEFVKEFKGTWCQQSIQDPAFEELLRMDNEGTLFVIRGKNWVRATPNITFALGQQYGFPNLKEAADPRTKEFFEHNEAVLKGEGNKVAAGGGLLGGGILAGGLQGGQGNNVSGATLGTNPLTPANGATPWTPQALFQPQASSVQPLRALGVGTNPLLAGQPNTNTHAGDTGRGARSKARSQRAGKSF